MASRAYGRLRSTLLVAGVAAVIAGLGLPAQTEPPADRFDGFEMIVDGEGAIRLPSVDFRREWEHLGTWSLDSADSEGAGGFHQVYTQPGVAEHYRRTGEFPDGAVLVKELQKASSADLTTGRASWGHEVEGWFVMVKDRRGRFQGNPVWAEGWGWSYFGVDDGRNTTTKTYQECLGCHVPAQDDDWVYIRAYPALASRASAPK